MDSSSPTEEAVMFLYTKTIFTDLYQRRGPSWVWNWWGTKRASGSGRSKTHWLIPFQLISGSRHFFRVVIVWAASFRLIPLAPFFPFFCDPLKFFRQEVRQDLWQNRRIIFKWMIFQPLELKFVKSFFEIISDARILFQEIHQFLHFKKDSVFGFKRLVSVPFVLKFPKPLKCVFFESDILSLSSTSMPWSKRISSIA